MVEKKEELTRAREEYEGWKTSRSLAFGGSVLFLSLGVVVSIIFPATSTSILVLGVQAIAFFGVAGFLLWFFAQGIGLRRKVRRIEKEVKAEQL